MKHTSEEKSYGGSHEMKMATEKGGINSTETFVEGHRDEKQWIKPERGDIGDGGSAIMELGWEKQMINGGSDQQIDPTLRLYAIVRSDLDMSKGKLAAQAGHAYLNSYLKCLEADPQIAKEYQRDGIGTKVCLKAPFNKLQTAYEIAIEEGLPCDLIIDSGHIMPPHFDGSPIITALGIGPILRKDIQHITKRFQVVE